MRLKPITTIILFLLPFSAFGYVDIQVLEGPKNTSIWLHENHNLPIVSIDIAFMNRGSAHVPIELSGITEIAENILDNGYNLTAYNDFTEESDAKRISINCNINDDAVIIHIDSLREYIDIALSWAKNIMRENNISEESFDEVRSRVVGNIKMIQESPSFPNEKQSYDVIFGSHPYNRYRHLNPVQIETLTLHDTQAYIAEIFTTNHIKVGISGDINPNETLHTISDIINSLPINPKNKPYKLEDINLQNIPGTTHYTKQQHASQSYINFFLQGVSPRDPQYMTASILINIMGGGGLNSKLTKAIREDKGMTYNVTAYAVNKQHASIIETSTSTAHDAQEVVGTIKDVLRDLKDNGVTAKELQDAKTQILNLFYMLPEKNSKMSSYILRLNTLDMPSDLNYYINQIKSTTIEDVNKIAQEIIDPDKAIFVVSQPQNQEGQ